MDSETIEEDGAPDVLVHEDVPAVDAVEDDTSAGFDVDDVCSSDAPDEEDELALGPVVADADGDTDADGDAGGLVLG